MTYNVLSGTLSLYTATTTTTATATATTCPRPLRNGSAVRRKYRDSRISRLQLELRVIRSSSDNDRANLQVALRGGNAR